MQVRGSSRMKAVLCAPFVEIVYFQELVNKSDYVITTKGASSIDKGENRNFSSFLSWLFILGFVNITNHVRNDYNTHNPANK